jgi:hypothetical protein
MRLLQDVLNILKIFLEKLFEKRQIGSISKKSATIIQIFSLKGLIRIRYNYSGFGLPRKKSTLSEKVTEHVSDPHGKSSWSCNVIMGETILYNCLFFLES